MSFVPIPCPRYGLKRDRERRRYHRYGPTRLLCKPSARHQLHWRGKHRGRPEDRRPLQRRVRRGTRSGGEDAITKFNALLKLVRKAIRAYGRTNKVKAQEFGERLLGMVEAYNNRDKLRFTGEVVSDFVDDLSDQLIAIMCDLEADKSSFAKMGITYEEKAFYDILVKVRDNHDFPYAVEKCVVLAKDIAKLVNDKAQFADWSTREDIKSQLSMELTVLLYKNGYPPQWDEEVFEKVLEQAENMKEHDAVE